MLNFFHYTYQIMAFGDEWDSQKMLDLYIHNYMVKNNMHEAAKIFAEEANVEQNTAFESTEGLLTEWWSTFWDMYSSRVPNHPEDKAESSAKDKAESSASGKDKEESCGEDPMMGNLLQNICAVMPYPGMNQQMAGHFPINNDLNNMIGQPRESLLGAKIFEEHCGIPPVELQSNQRLLNVDYLALENSSSRNASPLQMQASRKSQLQFAMYNKNGITLGRSNPMDSTIPGGLSATFRTTVHRAAGMDKEVSDMLMKGWPLIGVHPDSPGMGYHVRNSLLAPNNHQQFEISAVNQSRDTSSQGVHPASLDLGQHLRSSLLMPNQLQQFQISETNQLHNTSFQGVRDVSSAMGHVRYSRLLSNHHQQFQRSTVNQQHDTAYQGVDHFAPGMEYHLQNSLLLPNQHLQFQRSAVIQPHDTSSDVVANIGNSSNMLPRSDMTSRDGWKTVPTIQTAEKQRMVPIKLNAENQQQQQQLPESSRKSKDSVNPLTGETALSGTSAGVDKPLDEMVEAFLFSDDNAADNRTNS